MSAVLPRVAPLVRVLTGTKVAIAIPPKQVAVAVDTFTHVRAPTTGVDTRTRVGVSVTPKAVDVGVDTETHVRVKALLARIAVDTRVQVGVHVGRDGVKIGVHAPTRIQIDLGRLHLLFGDHRARLPAPR